MVQPNEELAFDGVELVAAANRAAGGSGQSGIETIDPLVAAVAVAVDEAVRTDTVDDFEQLGVEVET